MAAPSFPTPFYGHVGRGAFSDVYEPAEDTFLLLDALEAATAELAGCEEGEGSSGRGLGCPGEAAGNGLRKHCCCGPDRGGRAGPWAVIDSRTWACERARHLSPLTRKSGGTVLRAPGNSACFQHSLKNT
jgi:hypothetical protein